MCEVVCWQASDGTVLWTSGGSKVLAVVARRISVETHNGRHFDRQEHADALVMASGHHVPDFELRSHPNTREHNVG